MHYEGWVEEQIYLANNEAKRKNTSLEEVMKILNLDHKSKYNLTEGEWMKIHLHLRNL